MPAARPAGGDPVSPSSDDVTDFEIQASSADGSQEAALLHDAVQPSPTNPGVCAAAARAIWGSGPACVQIAAAAMALMGLFVKFLHRMGIFQIVLSRSLPCLILTVLLSRLSGILHTFGSRTEAPLLALRGAMGATVMILFDLAVLRIPLADAYSLYFMSPPITALLGWVLRLERINVQLGCGIASCAVGAVLVCHPPLFFGGTWAATRAMGVVFMGLSALFGAASYLLVGAIGMTVPTLTVMAWFHIVSSMATVVPMALGFPKPVVLNLGLKEGASVVGLTAASLAGQLLLTRGVQVCGGSRGATLSTTEVVFAHVLGYFILSEAPTVLGAGGSALVIVGVVLVAGGKDSRTERGRVKWHAGKRWSALDDQGNRTQTGPMLSEPLATSCD
eukprot:evm.model.scf_1429.7 EVM.evm.TU.scf_1429.7   scf_1429:33848-35733(+)